MAAHLNRIFEFLNRAIGSIVVAMMAGPAVAASENLADPTRPPALKAGTAAVAAGPARARQLQSILISPQRRVAVVDGETVRVGDMVGEARVVGIKETEVTLRAGSEVQVLRLYPDLGKKPAQAEAGPPTDKYKR